MQQNVYVDDNGVVYSGDRKTLKDARNFHGAHYVVPEGTEEIETLAFGNCCDLQTLSLPSALTHIDEGAFVNCRCRITCASKNFMVVDDALYMANGLVLLYRPTDVEAAEFDVPAGVMRIGTCACYGSKTLQRLTLPSTVEEIGESAFRECRLLAEAEKEAYLTVFEHPECNEETGETHIVLEEVATFTKIEKSAFEGCVALHTMSFTDVCAIGEKAFYGCSSLTCVVVPPFLDKITEMWAFLEKRYVEEIEIAEGRTVIDAGAFSDCPRLVSVRVPNSVKRIGEGCCYGCYALWDALPTNARSGRFVEEATRLMGGESKKKEALVKLHAAIAAAIPFMVEICRPQMLSIEDNYFWRDFVAERRFDSFTSVLATAFSPVDETAVQSKADCVRLICLYCALGNEIRNFAGFTVEQSGPIGADATIPFEDEIREICKNYYLDNPYVEGFSSEDDVFEWFVFHLQRAVEAGLVAPTSNCYKRSSDISQQLLIYLICRCFKCSVNSREELNILPAQQLERLFAIKHFSSGKETLKRSSPKGMDKVDALFDED